MSETLAVLASLTDTQLLEIIAGQRIRPRPDLKELARASPDELEHLGVEPNRAELIAVSFELARRAAALPRTRGDPLLKPQDVWGRYGPLLKDESRERVLALLLDSGKRLRREVTVSIGTVDSSLVMPRDALAEAVRAGAAGVIFVHYVPRDIMDVLCPPALCGRK